MRRLLPLLLATLVASLLAGCGGDDETEAPSGQAPAETRLTITVGGEGVEAQTIEFDCVADPCDQATLARLKKVTAPPDPARACTQIYGGPEEAHVSGTLEGEPVDATIKRSDGCGIAEYEALFAALGRDQPLAG
jgi:hypothetical protein